MAGVAASLKGAAADLYRHSLRLAALNALVAGSILAILLAATYQRLSLLALPLAGPLGLGLTDAALRATRGEAPTFRAFARAVRRDWRRGLALGAAVLGVAWAGVVAVRFYWGLGTGFLPLAAFAAYVLGSFLAWQLVAWPVVAAAPGSPLREALREAAARFFRRPGHTIALALALTLVNAIGLGLILPALTLTVSYSLLAAARFTVGATEPRGVDEPTHEEAAATWRA